MIGIFKRFFGLEMAPDEPVSIAPALLRKKIPWDTLNAGDGLRFGLVPLPELSEHLLTVEEVSQYHFQEHSYRALSLERGGEVVCQLIAGVSRSDKPYLAFSRLLNERDIEALVVAEDIPRLSEPQSLKMLYVREKTKGLKDWVTLRYERKIVDAQGHRELPDGTLERFHYSLFVNEANFKAVEIERDSEGELTCYATVYRPESDVVDMVKGRETKKRDPKLNGHTARDGGPAEIIHLNGAGQATEKPGLNGQHGANGVNGAHVNGKRRNKELLPAIIPGQEVVDLNGHEDSQKLTCDIKVAAKIIDEALRNDIQVSDLMKKVLDLPVAESDTIDFDLPLSDKEYAILAKRYELHPRDRKSIKEKILEELEAFTGESKPAKPAKVQHAH